MSITLFVTIDPIGNVPLFLSLTVGLDAARRRGIAVRGALIAFGRTGKSVLTRLLGVLLAALSVQYVADGVRALASAWERGHRCRFPGRGAADRRSVCGRPRGWHVIVLSSRMRARRRSQGSSGSS